MQDLRRIPIEQRKSLLAKLLSYPHAGIAFNQHYEADGPLIYKHACALGCEGIVSKRLGSAYRSGRADCWVKVKNPAAPAVTRETEEDWSETRPHPEKPCASQKVIAPVLASCAISSPASTPSLASATSTRA